MKAFFLFAGGVCILFKQKKETAQASAQSRIMFLTAQGVIMLQRLCSDSDGPFRRLCDFRLGLFQRTGGGHVLLPRASDAHIPYYISVIKGFLLFFFINQGVSFSFFSLQEKPGWRRNRRRLCY